MAKTAIEQGGQKASTYGEIQEHVEISGVAGKKVFVVDSFGNLKDSNSSVTVSYNSANEVVKLEKVVDGVTYTKLFTRVDNTVDHTLSISAWSV